MNKELLHEIDNITEILPEPAKKLAGDVLICECFCVSVNDIRQACKVFDLQIVQDDLQLGHGCQSCLRGIDSWVDKIF